MKRNCIMAALVGLIIPIFVSVGQNDSLDLPVTKRYALNEVVVNVVKDDADIRHLPMTVSVVDREKLQDGYRTSVLPTLTEQIPGLFISGRGIMGYGVSTGSAGSMNLRGVGGNTTTGVLVLIDGHPQYMGLMGHPIADAYQTMITEKVEVLRGPASVLYGSNAMGGVINVITRKVREDGVFTDLNVGYGSFNTLQTELTNWVKKGRLSSVVSASYNRTDGHRRDMEFEQAGGYAKLAYEVNEAWNLWGDVDVIHFNSSNPGMISKPYIDNDMRITRGAASLALENRYEHSAGLLSLFYNWGRHKINDGYTSGGTPQTAHFHSKDKMMGLSWYQSASFLSGNRLIVGFDYTHLGGKSWNKVLQTNEKDMLADKAENELAGYINLRQDVGSCFSLDVGVRADYHSQVGTEWVPQGGLAFHLPRAIELKAMASKGFRNPTIREMYMFPPHNPDLKPERLMNYEIAFSQMLLGNDLHYGVNLFYINGDNMIQTRPVGGKPLNINTGKIENWGVEADADYRINSQWHVNANYSWLHMENPVVAAPEHKLYGGADFRKDRWSVSAGLQYIKGLYTSADTQEEFILWNVNVVYRACRNLSFYVRGENLLAQRYEINQGYPMPKATVMAGVNLHF